MAVSFGVSCFAWGVASTNWLVDRADVISAAMMILFHNLILSFTLIVWQLLVGVANVV